MGKEREGIKVFTFLRPPLRSEQVFLILFLFFSGSGGAGELLCDLESEGGLSVSANGFFNIKNTWVGVPINFPNIGMLKEPLFALSLTMTT